MRHSHASRAAPDADKALLSAVMGQVGTVMGYSAPFIGALSDRMPEKYWKSYGRRRPFGAPLRAPASRPRAAGPGRAGGVCNGTRARRRQPARGVCLRPKLTGCSAAGRAAVLVGGVFGAVSMLMTYDSISHGEPPAPLNT
eukprot:SAG11_NODE_5341_length_1589_cov_2.867785_1_plen_140_part_10